MTDPTEAILTYLHHMGAGLDPDFLREAARVMSALLMEIEVKQQIGADRYERTEERTTYRNGYRERDWLRSGLVLERPAVLLPSRIRTLRPIRR